MPNKSNAKMVNTTRNKYTTKWLSNAMKNAGFIADTYLSSVTPNIYDIAKTGARAGMNIAQNVRHGQSGSGRITDVLHGNKYVKYAQEAYKNAITDLKEGRLDNTDRMLDSDSGFGMGLDDDSGFSFSDDSGDNFNIEMDTSAQNSALMSISDSIDKSTETHLKTSKASMDAFVAVNAASMQQIGEIGSQVVSQLTNVNENLAAIVQYNNDNMTKFIEASLAYYENMGGKSSPDKTSDNSVMATDVLRSDSGGINLSSYKNYIVQNLKKSFNESNLGMTKELLKMVGNEQTLQMFAKNPIGMTVSMVSTALVPKMITESLTSVEKTFEEYMPKFLIQLSDLANTTGSDLKSQFKRFIGKNFGLNMRRDSYIGKGDAKRGAIPFDGETKHAITEVITKELSQQTGYLKVIANHFDRRADTKMEASRQYWSYDKNKYMTKDEINKNIASEIMIPIKRALRESKLGDNLNDLALTYRGNNLDLSRNIEKITEELFYQIEKQGGELTADQLVKMISQLNSGSKEAKKIIKRWVQKNAKGKELLSDLPIYALNARRAANEAKKDLTEDYVGYNIGDSDFGAEADIDEVLGKVKGYNVNTLDLRTRSKKSRKRKNTKQIPSQEISGLSNRYNSFKETSKPSSSVKNGFLNRMTTNTNSMIKALLTADVSTVVDTAQESIRDGIKTIGDSVRGILFGREKDTNNHSKDGILSSVRNVGVDMLNSLKRTITGAGYVDRNGKIVEDVKDPKDSVLGNLKGIGDYIKTGIEEKLFGKKAKNATKVITGDENKGGLLSSFIDTMKAGFHGWADVFFGKDEDEKEARKNATKAAVDYFNKNKVAGLTGSLIGAGVSIASTGSLLGTIIGGPITGAAIGAVTGFASKSEKFQKFLFGEEDGNGEKVGGLISDKTQKFLKKNGHFIAGSSALGTVTGTITGGGLLGTIVGGPIAGAITGAISGMVIKSDKFQEFVFGKTDKDGNVLKDGILKRLQKSWQLGYKPIKKDDPNADGKRVLGMATIGTTAGGLIGTILGGPVVGAAAGLVSSIAASGNSFKRWFFGEKDGIELSDGKTDKKKGVLQRITDTLNVNILQPIANEGKYIVKEFENTLFHKILYPISFLGESLARKAGSIVSSVQNNLKGIADKTVGSLARSIYKGASAAFGPITRAIGNTAEKGMHMIFGGIEKAMSTPANILGALVKAIDFKNLIKRSPVGRAFRFVKKVAVNSAKILVKYSAKMIHNALVDIKNIITAPFKILGKSIMAAATGVSKVVKKVGDVIGKTKAGQTVKRVLSGYSKDGSRNFIGRFKDAYAERKYGTGDVGDTLGQKLNRNNREYKQQRAENKRLRKEARARNKLEKEINKLSKGQYSEYSENALDYIQNNMGISVDRLRKNAEKRGIKTVDQIKHERDLRRKKMDDAQAAKDAESDDSTIRSKDDASISKMDPKKLKTEDRIYQKATNIGDTLEAFYNLFKSVAKDIEKDEDENDESNGSKKPFDKIKKIFKSDENEDESTGGNGRGPMIKYPVNKAPRAPQNGGGSGLLSLIGSLGSGLLSSLFGGGSKDKEEEKPKHPIFSKLTEGVSANKSKSLFKKRAEDSASDESDEVDDSNDQASESAARSSDASLTKSQRQQAQRDENDAIMASRRSSSKLNMQTALSNATTAEERQEKAKEEKARAEQAKNEKAMLAEQKGARADNAGNFKDLLSLLGTAGLFGLAKMFVNNFPGIISGAISGITGFIDLISPYAQKLIEGLGVGMNTANDQANTANHGGRTNGNSAAKQTKKTVNDATSGNLYTDNHGDATVKTEGVGKYLLYNKNGKMIRRGAVTAAKLAAEGTKGLAKGAYKAGKAVKNISGKIKNKIVKFNLPEKELEKTGTKMAEKAAANGGDEVAATFKAAKKAGDTKGPISLLKNVVTKFFDFVKGKLEAKGFDVGEKGLTKILSPSKIFKVIDKYKEKLAEKVVAISGGKMTVEAATAGIGVVVNVSIGAINGISGTAKLFHCQKKDVDTTMRLISAAIGGFTSTSAGSLIDLINGLIADVLGVDLLSAVATSAYAAIKGANSRATKNLRKSQQQFTKNYNKYKESKIKKAYNTEKKAGLINKKMTYKQFAADVASGKRHATYKSAQDYNTEKNASLGDKISSIGGHIAKGGLNLAKAGIHGLFGNKSKVYKGKNGTTYKQDESGDWYAYDKKGNKIGQVNEDDLTDNKDLKKTTKKSKGLIGSAVDAVGSFFGKAKKNLTTRVSDRLTTFNAIKDTTPADVAKTIIADKNSIWYSTSTLSAGTYYKSTGKQFVQYNRNGDVINKNVKSSTIAAMALTGVLLKSKGNTTHNKKLDAKIKSESAKITKEQENGIKESSSIGIAVVKKISDKSPTKKLGKIVSSKSLEDATKGESAFEGKMYADVNGNYYKCERGKWNKYSPNGDIIGKNIDEKTIDTMMQSGILINVPNDSLRSTSTATKNFTTTLKKATTNVWNKAKSTVGGILNKVSKFFGFGGGNGMGSEHTMLSQIKNQLSTNFGINSISSIVADNQNNGGATVGGSGGGFGDTLNGSAYYSQNDSRWKDAAYNTGSDNGTMGNAGCGPTAMAMVASDMTGSGVSPTSMASLAEATGDRDSTGTNWNFINHASGAMGISSQQTLNPTAQEISNELDSGNPVILSGRSGGYGNGYGGFGTKSSSAYTPAGHYVVATGKDSNGNVIINDPRGKSYSGAYNINDVASETGSSWTFGGYGKKKKKSKAKSAKPAKTTTKKNTKSTGGSVDKNGVDRSTWLKIVRATKKAIAAQHPGYSKTNKITVTVGGKTIQVRTDCSGLISACLNFYGVYNGITNTSAMMAGSLNSTGFKRVNWPGWDNLTEGDIMVRDGHTEIFSRNIKGIHYVYNCGGRDSVNNPGITKTGHRQGYSIILQPCAAPSNAVDPGGDGSINAVGSALSGDASTSGTSTGNATTSSTSSGTTSQSNSVLKNLVSYMGNFATEFTNRALTGNYSTDYSNVTAGSTSTSSDANTSTTTNSTTGDSSTVGAANVAGGDVSEAAWKYFTSQGYSKAATAGIMGNLEAESGMNPKSREVGGRGRGLAQWTDGSDRFKGLVTLAKSKGKDWTDPGSQLEFINKELHALSSAFWRSAKSMGEAGTTGTTFDAWRKSTDIDTATRQFEGAFERAAAGESMHLPRRIGSAKGYYKKYANMTGTSTDANNDAKTSKKDKSKDKKKGGKGTLNIFGGGFGAKSSSAYTPAGHYVVATGKDDNGNVIINDPRGKSYSGAYDINDVASETGSSWTFGGYGKKKKDSKGKSAKQASKKTDDKKKSKDKKDKSAKTKTDKNNNATITGGSVDKNGVDRSTWLKIVRATKKAIAAQHPGYSQSRKITITVGGKTIKARTDCSGLVSACLNLYGVYNGITCTSAMMDGSLNSTGFKRVSWPGWDKLTEGDIMVRNGHTEIFSRNLNGTHYVYNCGSDSSVNNPGITATGHKQGYSIILQPCAAPSNAVDAGGDGSINAVGDALSGDASASSSSGGDAAQSNSVLKNLVSYMGNFATEFTNRALTGNYSTDYSNVTAGTTSSDTGTSTNSTGDSSTVGAANVAGGDVPEAAWKYFTSQGYSKAATAGIMGNLEAESSMDPKEYEVGGPGRGLAQWTNGSDRYKGLVALAKSRGKDWTDAGVQLEYINKELHALSDVYWKSAKSMGNAGTTATSFDEWRKSTDIDKATRQFEGAFERAKAGSTMHLDRRIGSAKGYYKKYANMTNTDTNNDSKDSKKDKSTNKDAKASKESKSTKKDKSSSKKKGGKGTLNIFGGFGNAQNAADMNTGSSMMIQPNTKVIGGNTQKAADMTSGSSQPTVHPMPINVDKTSSAIYSKASKAAKVDNEKTKKASSGTSSYEKARKASKYIHTSENSSVNALIMNAIEILSDIAKNTKVSSDKLSSLKNASSKLSGSKNISSNVASGISTSTDIASAKNNISNIGNNIGKNVKKKVKIPNNNVGKSERYTRTGSTAKDAVAKAIARGSY